MARPRRLARSRVETGLAPVCWRWLCDLLEPGDMQDRTLMYFRLLNQPTIPAEAWQQYGEQATAEHVAVHPGRRPELWWRWSAPEPRQVLSAKLAPRTLPPGMTASPDTGRILDYGVVAPGSGPGELVVESQAAYLRRLDVLLPGELRRLPKAAFEPEVVVVVPS